MKRTRMLMRAIWCTRYTAGAQWKEIAAGRATESIPVMLHLSGGVVTLTA